MALMLWLGWHLDANEAANHLPTLWLLFCVPVLSAGADGLPTGALATAQAEWN
jgi:hypothetical protein